MTKRLQHWILIADVIWIALSLPLAYAVRYLLPWNNEPRGSLISFVPAALIAIVIWAVMFSSMKLDGFARGWHLSAVVSQIVLAVSLLALVLLAGEYLARQFLSRLLLAFFLILIAGGCVAIRYCVHRLLTSRYISRAVRRVVIVGNGQIARETATKIMRHPELLYQVVGFLCSGESTLDPRMPGLTSDSQVVPSLGVVEVLRTQKVEEVILAMSRPAAPEVTHLAEICRQNNIAVSLVPHPYELYLSKPQLLDLGGLPLLQLHSVAGMDHALWKRPLDLVLAGIFFLFSLPAMVLAALGFAGREGGPLIREPRVGLRGETFGMWRFNSDRDATGLSFLERVAQQLSITEMPQLWNVFRGEMSIVGPRPESPERVRHYSEWQRQRLNATPGITGLAQVNGLRQQHSSEEKARFDLQYMLHASLLMDVSLMVQTFCTILGRVLRSRQHIAKGGRDKETGPVFPQSLPHAHSTQPSAD